MTVHSLIINTPYICPQQYWEQARDGTVSLPFEAGEHRKVAVKIVDDRGIESLKIISLE